MSLTAVISRVPRRLVAALAVSVAALTAGTFSAAQAGAAPAVVSPGAARPCGTSAAHPGRIDHVIWLWMENQPYDAIIGSRDAPYINHLADQCGLATSYHNITHPSAPEYLAATSGFIGGADDCSPDQCPDRHYSLFAQVTAAGETWKSYNESMGRNCLNAFGTLYDVNHNPAVYYPALHAQCATNDVPMGALGHGHLANDLATNLASFSFISPNLVHDTHNSNVATGDRYLRRLVPTILNSSYYKQGTTALFIVWDEGENGATNNCAYNTTDIGCHVASVVISPYTTPGTRSDTLFNHYSLLKTTEQLLGLPRYLGHAGDSRVHSMVPAFGL